MKSEKARSPRDKMRRTLALVLVVALVGVSLISAIVGALSWL